MLQVFSMGARQLELQDTVSRLSRTNYVNWHYPLPEVIFLSTNSSMMRAVLVLVALVAAFGQLPEERRLRQMLGGTDS